MKIKSALHIHVKGDPVDKIPYDFKELIDHAHKSNFKAIAITCHNYISPISKAKKYAEKKGISIISGTEIEIQNKHIVALNPSKEILKIKSFEALRKYKLSHKKVFIIAPHPYFPALNCLHGKLEKHIDIFDAIEFNYFYTKTINFNKKALRIAKKIQQAYNWNFGLSHVENTLLHIFGNRNSRRTKTQRKKLFQKHQIKRHTNNNATVICV